MSLFCFPGDTFQNRNRRDAAFRDLFACEAKDTASPSSLRQTLSRTVSPTRLWLHPASLSASPRGLCDPVTKASILGGQASREMNLGVKRLRSYLRTQLGDEDTCIVRGEWARQSHCSKVEACVADLRCLDRQQHQPVRLRFCTVADEDKIHLYSFQSEPPRAEMRVVSKGVLSSNFCLPFLSSTARCRVFDVAQASQCLCRRTQSSSNFYKYPGWGP